MSFKKCSAALFFLVGVAQAFTPMERFSPKACLEASYTSRIEHKGPLFGLLPHELVIEKKGCLITVQHRRWLPQEWRVDVCREPVHIKTSTATGMEVSKKTGSCSKDAQAKEGKSEFCERTEDLEDVIQDYGLIFAEGDRDSLNTPHGRTYCAYLLMRRYLKDGIMFSRYTDVPDIFGDHVKAAVTVPTEEESQPAPVTAPAVTPVQPPPKT